MSEEKIIIPNLNTPLGQMEYHYNNVNYMLEVSFSNSLVHLSNFYHAAITALKN